LGFILLDGKAAFAVRVGLLLAQRPRRARRFAEGIRLLDFFSAFLRVIGVCVDIVDLHGKAAVGKAPGQRRTSFFAMTGTVA
jgi:hypothetical protein